MPRDSAGEPGDISARELHPLEREQALAGIALLLGPDTDYHKRQRAVQRLVRAGPALLPLLIRALHKHPEILFTAWPWWPPQYEQVGRLLLQLCQQAQLALEDLLAWPECAGEPGPVLWTAVIEAAGRLPYVEHEPLLRAGLSAPWLTVRYAAVMALANRVAHNPPGLETRQMLLAVCRSYESEPSVRLMAAGALVRCADESGLEVVLDFLAPAIDDEYRKAALFLLATELPNALVVTQRATLLEQLLRVLQDADPQLAQYAARALSGIATVETLPSLSRLLETPCIHTRMAVLSTLEELARRKVMRYVIQQQQIVQKIAALVQVEELEMRRQACYTLATVGGNYTTGVLGTIILDVDHPAYVEAIEALRLLPDVQHLPVMTRIIRWLLYALGQPQEKVQVCALDTLSYLIVQARSQRQRQSLQVFAEEVEQSRIVFQLLASSSPRVRQRTIELLGIFDAQLITQRVILLEMLRHDIEGSVRATIASMLGQNAAIWALPDLLLALLDSEEYVAEAALVALCALPLQEEELLIQALKEVGGYRLPVWRLSERRNLARSARQWLQRRGTVRRSVRVSRVSTD